MIGVSEKGVKAWLLLPFCCVTGRVSVLLGKNLLKIINKINMLCDK